MDEWSTQKCVAVIVSAALSVAAGIIGLIAVAGIVLNMQPSKDYRLMKACIGDHQSVKACSDAIYGPPGLPK
jgi:hypothetical protein